MKEEFFFLFLGFRGLKKKNRELFLFEKKKTEIEREKKKDSWKEKRRTFF